MVEDVAYRPAPRWQRPIEMDVELQSGLTDSARHLQIKVNTAEGE